MVGEQRGRGGWARLRGGFDAGARLGEAGHARAVTRKPEERSVSAPQVRTRCRCKLGNCACERSNGARDDNCENCTAREGQNGQYSGSRSKR
eukprot:2146728-Pleurochrysis_carterae.AAC.1